METSTRIAAVRGVLPLYSYTQREITDAFSRFCLVDGQSRALLDKLHSSCRVERRNLVLPLERYAELAGFGDANDLFIDAALDLGEQAITAALADAGLVPTDVDLLIATSVTGIAAPSIDALLANRLGMRPDVKRVPIFGLGCVAGAAGIARLHDYLRAWPDQVAVLLSVELCSLTIQRADSSVPNLIVSGLFGDGAAAVVAVGAERAADLSGPASTGPGVVATRSRLYPGTEHLLGWDIVDSGFRIVLAADMPALIGKHLRTDVEAFLGEHALVPAEVASWICHPGGPKVLEATEHALDLPAGALDSSWRSLADCGNLSSSSVLHILQDTMCAGELSRPAPGTSGLMLGLGPGFAAELVLLQW